jgi:enoyl-CoA hydratase/carnithine racemase
MILTGKTLKPEKAKKLGLVDLVVDPFSLESVAITQVLKRNRDLVKRLLYCFLGLSRFTVLNYSSLLSYSASCGVGQGTHRRHGEEDQEEDVLH